MLLNALSLRFSGCSEGPLSTTLTVLLTSLKLAKFKF